MSLNLFLTKWMKNKRKKRGRNGFYPCTLFVSVEEDALSFEDEDDVFWIGAVQDSCRLCAKELIGFIDFLKHVLKDR